VNQDNGVRLRAAGTHDEAALSASRDDQLGRRFLPRDTPVSSAGSYAIIAGGAADPVGGIELDQQSPGRGAAEVRFWVAPGARRRGAATAALRTLSEQIFAGAPGMPRLQRLELLIHQDNPVAQRVALAAGYVREGERRGALPNPAGGRDDMLVYSRLAGDTGVPAERLLPDLPGGELTDGVVTLRPLGPADIDFYTELHAIADVIDTSVPPHQPSPEEVRRRCTWAESNWLAGTRADMVVVDTETGAPTGGMGLFYMEPSTGQAMIGYSQLPAWRGRGYVTRAVQLLSLWVFAETGVARLIAGTNPTNKGSQRVLERAGFHQEAYLRSRLPGPGNTRVDDVQYVLLPEDVLRHASSAAFTPYVPD